MQEEENDKEDIAIIGISCRFPHSETPDIFWKNLLEEKELITRFSEQELLDSGLSEAIFRRQNYVPCKGYIDQIDQFDRNLFSITSKEALYMDPQQRLLFECTWEAFEDACRDIAHNQESVGVFLGGNTSQYYMDHLASLNGEEGQDEMLKLIGNGSEYLATRLSYAFNFTGPSETIQTACSSSLVAVHNACRSLLSFECDLALSGGVSVMLPKKSGYHFTPDSIYSLDGHCRPFSKQSSGTVFSDGAGVVLLKRKTEALKAGDKIHAIIRGSFVNNDGANKVSFYAPSVSGQAEVIAQTLAIAGVNAESISYIEAHGTGTAIGDVIEVKALKEAFSLFTKKTNYCALGSVKSNLGHLNAAAGIAGLLKAIFITKTQIIPSTLHCLEINPELGLDSSAFYIPKASNHSISTHQHPIRVGVSSFGIGGTNAHIILEGHRQEVHKTPRFDRPALIPLSAATPSALKKIEKNLLDYLLHSNPNIHDLAYTLQKGRKTLSCRKTYIAYHLEELIHLLEESEIQEGSFNPEEKTEVYQIANLWKSGKTNQIDLYKGFFLNKLSLPFYPFERKKFWVEKSEALNPSNAIPSHSDELEAILRILWDKALGKVAGEKTYDFFQLGGDSLQAIELIDTVKRLFSIEISLSEFYGNSDLPKMTMLLRKKIEERLLNEVSIDSMNLS